ncbi:hypothetical protein [Roseofilum capinflatum]|uniref:Uncharacterized protein n=1 Tax=Roseofilum capinflatum BLCC-M114 TaxID=3022440 RepID=A0ABT7BBF9_9CYAN|nr:hypothetical protein [Roseofilum capinflatum]MDJ1176519.1 hypothetical protein [Roseofilum capinflatum BLCC-M114]
MNEEHTPTSPFESPECEPTAESVTDNPPTEPEAIAAGVEVNPETESAEFTDVSVELKLEAITHDSLNWQDIEESVNECIAPEVLEALQQEMEQALHKNGLLLDRISQLENALAHSQHALQTYQERQPATEALLSQRLEEINTLQEENKRLLRELEQSRHSSQRQQILVETLTEQLESSQTQTARLERDCAIAQQRCHEQATQLNQRDKFCIDLQTRLHRQQRYTLQFKNALDRCLELSPSHREHILNESPETLDPKLTKLEPGLTPKVVAIQPWSINQWQDAVPETERCDPQPEAIASRDGEDRETLSLDSPESGTQPPTSAVNRPPLKLFKPEESLASNPEPPQDSHLAIETGANSPPIQASQELEELEDSEDLDPEPPSFSAEFDDTEETFSEPEEPAQSEGVTDNSEDSDPSDEAEEIPAQQTSPSDEPERESPVNLPQGNWPSPLVYPLRPPKKRKSFAAIDLPSFPRS